MYAKVVVGERLLRDKWQIKTGSGAVCRRGDSVGKAWGISEIGREGKSALRIGGAILLTQLLMTLQIRLLLIPCFSAFIVVELVSVIRTFICG